MRNAPRIVRRVGLPRSRIIMRVCSLRCGLLLSILVLAAPAARADEMSAQQRKAVKKGLEWLAKNQHKDGHWSDQYPVTMTGVSGMALLMEGSTIREGKYKDNIRRAVDWLMAHSQPNGMIGNPN